MIDRRAFCTSFGAVVGGVATASLTRSHARAQMAFPTRPLRLIVPYAAGGGTDALARVVAQAMGEKLGQSVIVDNLSGAGGNIATTTAASSAPDGYTILMANQGPMAVNPHIFKNLRVDPLTAFDPVTLIAAAPLLVVVPEKSRFASLAELVDFAAKNPGKLTYGSAGNGSASHLATILLNVTAKITTVHVPYKGAGPALNDLLGGQTDFMVTTVPSVIGMVEGGKLKALAVTTKDRTQVLPNLPTVAESGWPDYESSAWYGFVVPKGTPAALTETLRKATVDAIKEPLIRSRLDNEGARPIGNSPAEFAAFMKKDSARWASIAGMGAIAVGN